MSRRVVVTGVGPISSIGIGMDAFLSGLRAGATGVSPIRSFDTTGFPHVVAGEVHDFDPAAILKRLIPQEWGRTSQFAAAAARLAVQDSGIDPGVLRDGAVGSCVGTTGGEAQMLESVTEDSLAGGFADVSGDRFGQVPASRLAVAVNRELGLTGEAVTLSTACSASNYAIGRAYDVIRSGEADHMLAGGADSVARWSHAGFFRLGAVAEERCRPFDAERTGIITGEGGAALLLEDYDYALARGARVYAEVLGYGQNCDANHMTSPHQESIAACMRLAHAEAGVQPQDVDYICAHGTGTKANDLTEASAIVEVFGEHPPPVSSIKSMLGHSMGAASGFSAIASVLGILHGFLPPTINFSELDPQIPPIDTVPNVARDAEVRVAQVNGFAFGGNNSITVFGKAS